MDAQSTVKRLNWKAIGILAAVTAAVGTTVHFVHTHQVKQNAHILAEEAAAAEKAGKPAEAADWLGQYLQLKPEDTDARAKLGLILAKEAKDNRAKKNAYVILSQALQADPNRQDVRLAMAKLGLESRDTASQVRQLLADLRKAGQNDAEVAALQARVEVIEGKYEAASRAYRTAVQLDPQNVVLSMEWAAVLREKQDTPGAADEEVDRLVRASKGTTPARLAAARYYRRWGNLEKAEQALTGGAADALSDDPEVLVLAVDLAAARAAARGVEPDAARGHAEAARRHAERGAKAHPKDTRFAIRLARHELAAGSRDRAKALVQPALTDLPKDPDEIWTLGNLLIDLDQPDLIETLIGRLEKDKDTPAWAIDYLRGRVAFHRGDWAGARRRLADAATAGGQRPPPPALAQFAYRMIADCYEKLGNPDQRLAACRKAVEVDPTSPPARAQLAAALTAAGKTAEAITEYRGLADKSPAARVELARLVIARTLRQPEADRRWGEAEKLLDDLPDQHRPEAQLLRAEVLTAQGKLADARKLVVAVRDQNPKQVLPWAALAALAGRESGPAAVLPVLDEAERATGRRAEWVLARAWYWVRTGGPEAKAKLAALEAGLGDLPDPGPALVGLGDAFQTVGDPASAERVWQRAADRRPDDLEARFRLFGLAVQKTDDAQARGLIDQIAKVEGGGGPLAGYAEATLHTRKARQGDRAALDQARQALGRAAAARPDWSRVALLDAELCELEGQRAQALEKYLAVAEAGEAPLEVVRRTVFLLYQDGRYADARALLQKLPKSAVAAGGLTQASAALALLDARQSGGLDAAARRSALEEARQAFDPKTARYQDYLWLGEMALMAGDPAEAEKAFRKARDLDPTAPEPWVAVVAVLAKSDPKKAEAELEAAKLKVPPDRLPRVLAVGLEVLGRTKEAADQYQTNAAARPDDPSALRDLAAFHIRTGNLAKAEEAFRKLLALGPRVPDVLAQWARRALALTLVDRGTYPGFQEALSLLDQNAAKAPGSVEDEWVRALVLATQQNHRRPAIAILEKLTGSPTASPHVRFLLAKLYDQDGQWDQAQAELLKLLGDPNPDPNVMAYYARALLRRDEPARAEEWVDRLAKAAGETFPVVELRARVLAGKKQPQDAARVIRAYVQKHGPGATAMAAGALDRLDLTTDAEELFRAHAAASKEPAAPLLLARFLSRRGKLAEALDLCEKARPTAPPEVVLFTAVGGLRAGHGTDEQAARVQGWVDEVAKKNTGSIGLMLIQADLMGFRKQFDQTVEVYRRVLERDPQNVIALNNLGFLLTFKDGRAEEGLALLNKAVEAAGPNPELLDTRATILIRAGRPDDAVEDLKQALALDPSPVKQFHLATAHMAADRKPQAASAYKAAQDAGFKVADLHPLEHGDRDKLVRYLATR